MFQDWTSLDLTGLYIANTSVSLSRDQLTRYSGNWTLVSQRGDQLVVSADQHGQVVVVVSVFSSNAFKTNKYTVKPFFRGGQIFVYFAENENSAKIKSAKIKIDKSHCRSVCAVCMYAYCTTHKICLICYPCLLKSIN